MVLCGLTSYRRRLKINHFSLHNYLVIGSLFSKFIEVFLKRNSKISIVLNILPVVILILPGSYFNNRTSYDLEDAL